MGLRSIPIKIKISNFRRIAEVIVLNAKFPRFYGENILDQRGESRLPERLTVILYVPSTIYQGIFK